MSITARPVGEAAPRRARRRPPELVLTVAGVAVFMTAAFVGAMLQPASYRWTRDTISVLAAQDAVAGQLMVAGFVGLGIGYAALAIGLWRRLTMASGRIAAVLVGVSAVATVVAGLARIRCNPAVGSCLESLESDPSISSEIHFRVAVLVFAPLVLSGFLLAWSQWRAAARRLAATQFALALASAALIVLTEDVGTGVGGLTQRLFLLTSLLPGLLLLSDRRRIAG